MAFNKKIFDEDREYLETILGRLDENSNNVLYFTFFWIAKSVYDVINYIIEREINND